MADGPYVALNGLRTRLTELDRLAADLANVGTAGYKGERASIAGAERPTFDSMMQRAVDPVAGGSQIDLAPGELTPTGRDLDFAVDGNGFFSVQTPAGTRYTRNGSFDRRADGVLVTSDGHPVLGQAGPIQLGSGAIGVDPDGTVRTGDTIAGKLAIVAAAPGAEMVREGAGRFRISQVAAVETPVVRNGAIERSNVSVVDALAHLTAVTRSFEALQRGLVSIMTDVDGRAISELGRRA